MLSSKDTSAVSMVNQKVNSYYTFCCFTVEPGTMQKHMNVLLNRLFIHILHAETGNKHFCVFITKNNYSHSNSAYVSMH